jgi:hypothetical protein
MKARQYKLKTMPGWRPGRHNTLNIRRELKLNLREKDESLQVQIKAVG